MQVPILKQGDFLIATIQAALTDNDLRAFRTELFEYVIRARSRGIIIDVTALDVFFAIFCDVNGSAIVRASPCAPFGQEELMQTSWSSCRSKMHVFKTTW